MKDDKKAYRCHCREIRENLAPDKVQAQSQRVCEHLARWPTFQKAQTVLSYLAFGNEIDLGALFERFPHKRWLVPRIVSGIALSAGQKPYLVLHPYDPQRLVRHSFGMLEPDPGLPLAHPNAVELVLIPGVAFDQAGGRLGFGGGFYDRLLPQLTQAVRIGVTYEELIRAAIPMQPWDCYVNWLATPQGITRTTCGL